MEQPGPGSEAEQDKLMAGADRYRFLLENSGDILWTVDLSGRWMFMTKNVERIAHIPLSVILKKTVWDFIAPEYIPVLKDKLKRRLQGEVIPPYVVEIVNGYGHRAPFEVMTSPIRNDKGEIIGIQGISRDITERKHAEDAARRSEEKFRNLIENIYDWVWETNSRGIFTYTNPRVLDYLGYRPEEVLGRSIYSFMIPEHAKKIVGILDSLARGHRAYIVAEKTLISKQGELIYFEMNVSPVYYDDGSLKGFRGICRDVRDRKRAEDAMRRAYEQLEKRVEERTRELEEAKAQAELYLDLMSHDINNMNMVAIGNLEMLRQIVAGNSSAMKLVEGALDMMNSSSRLIQNVSKLQRAEHGDLEPKIVDLCSVLEDVRDKYSKMPDRNVMISVHYRETNGCLVMTNRLVEDVFSNLVDNSIKHATRDTPVVIDIYLSMVREGQKICYRVAIEDQGPGIPDDVKARLFSRLERGRTKAKGRGLGLYLVRTLVNRYGGSVWVEDRVPGEYRKGSRFIVLLPAAPPGQAMTHAPA